MATENIEFVITARDAAKAVFDALGGSMAGASAKFLLFKAAAEQAINVIGQIVDVVLPKMAKELDDNAVILDVHAQTLRDWQHIASEAGIAGDQFVHILERLERSAGEAARGNNKELLQTFKELGITQADLLTHSKNLADLYPFLIQRLRDLGVSYAQVSDVVKIFGRDAVDLVRVVRQTSDEADAATTSFHALAGELTDEQIAQVAKMRREYESFGDSLKERVLTWVVQVDDKLHKLGQEAVLRNLQSDLADLQDKLKSVDPKTQGAWDSIWSSISGGTYAPFIAQQNLIQIKQQIEAKQKEIADFIASTQQKVASGASGGGHSTGISILPFTDEDLAAMQSNVDIVEASLSDYQTFIEQLNNDIGRHRSANITAEANAVKGEIELNNARVDAAQRTEDAISSIQRKATQARFEDAAASILGSIASATQGHKRLFELSKAAAIASAIVSTYRGATEALAFEPWSPANYAMAAAVVAAGLANVATIASTQFGSTATPTSSAGPGGFTATSPGQPGPPQIAVPAGGQQTPSINVTVSAGDDSELSRALVKMMSAEIQQNDAVLFRKDSRQAAELA